MAAYNRAKSAVVRFSSFASKSRQTVTGQLQNQRAALSGYGIAYVPENIVERYIASGLLRLILDDWSPLFDGYFLYYPSRRQNLPAFKVIVEALRFRG